MDARQYEELASRWVAGDRLAPGEEQFFLEWLEKRSDARTAMLEDETLDSLLLCWSQFGQDGRGFRARLPARGCGRGHAHSGCRGGSAADRRAAGRDIGAARGGTSLSLRRAWQMQRHTTPFASSGTCHPASFRLHGPFDKAIRWATAVFACCAALVLVAVGWRWLAGGRQPGEENRLASHSADSHIPQPEPPGAFATLAKCSARAEWETPHVEGDRLAAGELKLTAGTAELHFDKGTVAGLTGPRWRSFAAAGRVPEVRQRVGPRPAAGRRLCRVHAACPNRRSGHGI